MILSIIMAIENEEERSFVESIYHNYRKNMLGICYDVLKNRADANDALSDTFENIIKTVKYVQAAPKHKLPALLHTYAYNAAIDMYRRNKISSELFSSTVYHSEEDDNVQIDLHDSTFDLEQHLLDKALIVEIFHMIDEFPPSLKSVALLKWQFNYRNNEIAEILHISESAVSTRVERARQLLGRLLAQKHSHI